MDLVNLFERKTFKYRDGWSHEDNWNYLGAIKLTPPKITRRGEEYDEGDTYVRYARLPAGVDAKRYARAVEDTMRGSNCRHEYDCCGCPYFRVDAKLIATRKLLIHTAVTYNY